MSVFQFGVGLHFWEVQYSALVLVFKSGQTETVFTLLGKLGALTISKETSLES
jgi:hypothetical protein